MPVNGSGRFIGPGQPIRDGLIGWYDSRYKEPDLGTGNNWFDISNNGEDLTQFNSPAWSYGYYFDLDGSNDYFRSTSLPTDIGTLYTIEGWYDGDADTSVDYYFDWRTSTGVNYLLKESNGYDANFNQFAKLNWSNGYQNWHQIVIVQTTEAGDPDCLLYINGEEVASGTAGVSDIEWDSGKLTIGTDYNGGNYWNGKVGCIRAYDRVLSATEIRHNFLCDAGRFAVTIEGTS